MRNIIFLMTFIFLIVFAIISCTSGPPPECEGHLLRGDKHCLCFKPAKHFGELATFDTLDVPLRRCVEK